MSDQAHRKILLGELVDDKSFEYFVQNGARAWQDYARQIMQTGKVENQ